MKLQAYEFAIEFVKGKKNVVADALSKRPHICALVEIIGDLLKDFHRSLHP